MRELTVQRVERWRKLRRNKNPTWDCSARHLTQDLIHHRHRGRCRQKRKLAANQANYKKEHFLIYCPCTFLHPQMNTEDQIMTWLTRKNLETGHDVQVYTMACLWKML